MRCLYRARARRLQGDRGAAMVEMALMAFPVFLVTFAILEGGLYFKDYLTIGYASRNGARAAAAQDKDALADWDIIRSVDKSLAALNAGDLELVVIFKAAGFDDTPPAACKSGVGVPGVCNVYTPVHLTHDFDTFRDPAYSARLDWKGEERDVTEAGGTDMVGVYVRARHHMITGIYGDTRTIEDTTVMRIEPKLA